MVYQSTLMKSNFIEECSLIVRNREKNVSVVQLALHPSVRIMYQPFVHPNPPLILELILSQGKINIENENLEGELRLKESS